MTDFDIVIVNYKSAAHTFECVKTAHRVVANDGVTTRIVVVNNADDAAALDAAVDAAGGATVIHSPENVGFGVASNMGAQRGDARYLLFLNPDARLETGALRAMRAFLDDPRNANIGVVGPEIHDGSGRLVRSSSRIPTACDLLLRSIGAHVLFPGRGYPFLPLKAHHVSGIVGQVMGAALVIRRPLFEALGGFDPAFFLYYEDVDLCARAAVRGWGCYYLKDARAIHIGRASSSQDPAATLALHVRSRIIYARKHFGRGVSAILSAVCRFIEFPLRLLRGNFGVMAAYRNLPWA